MYCNMKCVVVICVVGIVVDVSFVEIFSRGVVR